MPNQTNLALYTDLYQLTMCHGYWKHRLSEHEAVFHLFFRKAPFGGEYTIAAGLQTAIDWLQNFRFVEDDLSYLAGLTGGDGQPLFPPEFLQYLADMRLRCDIDAIAEGELAFAHEPLIRVQGPIAQCQLLETALLNIVNFQTLIATKSARICQEAQGDPILEFGLRRAQGIDGGLSASRAAYIGGCVATSNVLAGQRFGIPVKGTHAHSWVMTFPSELESFEAYAEAMPNNCVFLVDTYDTVEGVRNAILVGRKLKERGHAMVGIRLDSGDLAELSKAARVLLDDAGFPDAAIVASNNLDEYLIRDLKHQEAKINVWGIGTRLATAFDQPALGGVYKLSAIRAPGEDWAYKIKLSEQAIKVSNPGRQQVRRYTKDGQLRGDVIFDENLGKPKDNKPSNDDHRDLLQPIFRSGELVYQAPTLKETREQSLRTRESLAMASRRLNNPTPYSVSLETNLNQLKNELIAAAQGGENETN